jgi:hypothetical protein
MTPFVLKGRKKLPPETEPSPEQSYDRKLQLWISRTSGLPLVVEMRQQLRALQFGETKLTETREGADQSELASIEPTKFGETTVTATVEGVDQPDIAAFQASEFGETTITKTLEGVDQPERHDALSSEFGETTFTRTREGVDQSESDEAQAA